MRIADVLSAKPSQDVITIRPEAGVRDLLALLADHNVGALIVSERDVVRHLHHDGTVINQTVGDIMTADVATCPPDTQLDDLMKVMTERRIRHVPVLDDGRMVGIVSIGDVVKHRIDQLQFERDQLDSYVHRS